jgi:hypothetical protein
VLSVAKSPAVSFLPFLAVVLPAEKLTFHYMTAEGIKE